MSNSNFSGFDKFVNYGRRCAHDAYMMDRWSRMHYSGYRRPVEKTWWNTPMKPHKAAYFFCSIITFGMLPLMVLVGKVAVKVLIAVCKLLIAVICNIGKDSK